MSVQIRITSDSISPRLARAIRGTSNPRSIMEAMGLQLVAITKGAFSNPALRASAWAQRKSQKGTHQLLRKSGALWQSIRISELSADSVTVGSDRIYAAIQQLGSAKKSGRGSGIPARPFFPFVNSEMTPLAKQKIEQIARAKIAAMLRG